MGNLKDFATSTILTPPSPANSGTTIVVQTGHGARFPAVPFMVTVHPPAEFPTLDNAEKLEVTAKTDDTFTVLRAQGDTTAKTIEAGWRISNALFFGDIPVVNSTTVDAAGATMNSDTNVKTNSWVKDEDNMSSNDDTKVPTQQSVKAYVDAAITAAKEALLPVGSIVVLGVATNPATLYGFGTWTAIEGRVLTGKAASGTFGTLDATGGAETHTLTQAQIPNFSGWWGATVPGGHGGFRSGIIGAGGQRGNASYSHPGGTVTVNTWSWTIDFGGGQSHPILQPYIVKYMWQRTA